MRGAVNRVASNATSRAVNTATNKVNSKVSRVANKVNSKLNTTFPLVDANTNAWLIVDGREYEINQFSIDFRQWVDHKGQPQSDMRGGKMYLVLTEVLPESMYYWAVRTHPKSGEVVFKSQTGSAPLKVEFIDGYCIDLVRTVVSGVGLRTNLVISAKKVVVNGITLDRRWVK